MWIQNVPRYAVETGEHQNPTRNSMLIQISDPDLDFPIPAFEFAKVHQYKFLDHDDATHWTAISDEQAQSIVSALQFAQAHSMNVVVHCSLGWNRSGAVTEVGIMMGFDDTHRPRGANMLVKHKLMKVLGWTYD